MKSKRNNKQKGVAKKVVISVVAGLLISFVAGTIYEDSSRTQGQPFAPPIELQEVGKQLGLGKELVDAKAQIGAPQGCISENAAGCYQSRDQSVHVYVAAFTKEQPNRVLAYEYYHYVWNNLLSAQERGDYKSEIDALAQGPSNKAFTRLRQLENALPGSALYYDEGHSIACTLVNDSELSPKLLAHCNKYIPHREVIERLY